MPIGSASSGAVSPPPINSGGPKLVGDNVTPFGPRKSPKAPGNPNKIVKGPWKRKTPARKPSRLGGRTPKNSAGIRQKKPTSNNPYKEPPKPPKPNPNPSRLPEPPKLPEPSIPPVPEAPPLWLAPPIVAIPLLASLFWFLLPWPETADGSLPPQLRNPPGRPPEILIPAPPPWSGGQLPILYDVTFRYNAKFINILGDSYDWGWHSGKVSLYGPFEDARVHTGDRIQAEFYCHGVWNSVEHRQVLGWYFAPFTTIIKKSYNGVIQILSITPKDPNQKDNPNLHPPDHPEPFYPLAPPAPNANPNAYPYPYPPPRPYPYPYPGEHPLPFSPPRPLPPLAPRTPTTPGPNKAPKPGGKPGPAPAPGTLPYPSPGPGPAPAPGTLPYPSPGPGSKPYGDPKPTPTPVPTPPQPAPRPKPVPRPKPKPTPSPKNKCEPSPEPKPKPKENCCPEVYRIGQVVNRISTSLNVPFSGEYTLNSCDKSASKKNSKNQVFKYAGTGLKGLSDEVNALSQMLNEVGHRLCNIGTPIATMPEWWQIRAGADRPQLVILYREKTDDQKKSYWTSIIPHPKSNINKDSIKAAFKDYSKGSLYAKATLSDNSKIWINASSQDAAKAVCKGYLSLVDPKLATGVQIATGKTDRKASSAKVEAIRADLYLTGRKNNLPDNSWDLEK